MGRLAGYEDINDAERLAHDPVIRQVVGHRAIDGQAASTPQMSRFETAGLGTANVSLNGIHLGKGRIATCILPCLSLLIGA